MMTLRQIRHFIAVAVTCSISAAAQTVFIAQSTLTPVSYTHLDVYKGQRIMSPLL